MTEAQMLDETKKMDTIVKFGCELRYENLRYIIDVLTEEKEERDQRND
tara:strand:+ start:44 stop:187 length:144 start_codon:yes stop_codon:yes gene_type:complete